MTEGKIVLVAGEGVSMSQCTSTTTRSDRENQTGCNLCVRDVGGLLDSLVRRDDVQTVGQYAVVHQQGDALHSGHCRTSLVARLAIRSALGAHRGESRALAGVRGGHVIHSEVTPVCCREGRQSEGSGALHHIGVINEHGKLSGNLRDRHGGDNWGSGGIRDGVHRIRLVFRLHCDQGVQRLKEDRIIADAKLGFEHVEPRRKAPFNVGVALGREEQNVHLQHVTITSNSVATGLELLLCLTTALGTSLKSCKLQDKLRTVIVISTQQG